MLSFLTCNWLNGTVKEFLSELLMMKDDMLVPLLSTPAAAHHASLMAAFISCNALSVSDGSHTVSSLLRFISTTNSHSAVPADAHIHRMIVGGECHRACCRCHDNSPMRCQTSVWKRRINARISPQAVNIDHHMNIDVASRIIHRR